MGLTSWTGQTFEPDFELPLQGDADVITTDGDVLYQDVYIADQPANSPYLFSFGAFSAGAVSLTIRIQWLDSANIIIGPPGLEFTIPVATLSQQESYLTYLDLTNPAPNGAVKARILFDPVISEENKLKLDQVILVRACTPNLLANPSFEEGLDNWTSVNTILNTNNDVYAGRAAAEISSDGGFIFQDVRIPSAKGHCFLFNSGIRIRRSGGGGIRTDILVKVIWLDNEGREIGLGLSIIGLGINPVLEFSRWLVYTGITEPAPPGTVAARIQFTRPNLRFAFIDIDKVVLGRLV